MSNLSKKVVILELMNENATQCTRLLEDNGYQVEIIKNYDVATHSTSTLTSNTTSSLTSQITSDKYTNVIELDLNIPKPIKNKDNVLIQNTCLYLRKNIYSKLILDDISSSVASIFSASAIAFKIY